MLRERLMSIPGKISASMCELRDLEQFVRDEVYEIVDELSRPILLSGHIE
jgi:hypothetical protein